MEKRADAKNAGNGNINNVTGGRLEIGDGSSKQKKFRVNAHKFFLTYPQCNLEPADVLAFLKQKGFITRYTIGRERHEDGNPHIHAVVEYATKLNVVSEKAFDHNGFHPNIQPCRSYENSSAYAAKDGDFITGTKFNTADPKNYKKRKQDWQAWTEDQEFGALAEIKWPIELPTGDLYNPNDRGKKRHVWIVGKPDSGKSTWAKKSFQGKRVYLRPSTKYPFERYKGEEVIVYDDIYPSQEEWLNVSNPHWNKSHVFGDTRYNANTWPDDVNLTMIVLSNMEPIYNNMEAFHARFSIIRINGDD